MNELYDGVVPYSHCQPYLRIEKVDWKDGAADKGEIQGEGSKRPHSPDAVAGATGTSTASGGFGESFSRSVAVEEYRADFEILTRCLAILVGSTDAISTTTTPSSPLPAQLAKKTRIACQAGCPNVPSEKCSNSCCMACCTSLLLASSSSSSSSSVAGTSTILDPSTTSLLTSIIPASTLSTSPTPALTPCPFHSERQKKQSEKTSGRKTAAKEKKMKHLAKMEEANLVKREKMMKSRAEGVVGLENGKEAVEIVEEAIESGKEVEG